MCELRSLRNTAAAAAAVAVTAPKGAAAAGAVQADENRDCANQPAAAGNSPRQQQHRQQQLRGPSAAGMAEASSGCCDLGRPCAPWQPAEGGCCDEEEEEITSDTEYIPGLPLAPATITTVWPLPSQEAAGELTTGGLSHSSCFALSLRIQCGTQHGAWCILVATPA